MDLNFKNKIKFKINININLKQILRFIDFSF